MTVLLDIYKVEELVVSTFEQNEGIGRRWAVSHRWQDERRYVVQTSHGGRWAGQPALLCSCAFSACVHRDAVREATAPAPLPPAA